jgi:signal recognition particle receptor subunit beta
MVQFRPRTRELITKVVYYGPPLGGKTTNLHTLYDGYPPATRGELVVVPAGGDRTIFFDFLPVDAGTLHGMRMRVQLYTVPGQVHYNATRQIVLRGVDGVVFVADSQPELLRANRESWENLKENLALQGLTLANLPHVLQYNKRDLADILSVDDLDEALNEFNAPFFEAVSTTGIGVEETLHAVVKLVVRSLRDRFKMLSGEGGEVVEPFPVVPLEGAAPPATATLAFMPPVPTFGAPPSDTVFAAPEPPAAVTAPLVLAERFDACVVPFGAPPAQFPPVQLPPVPPVDEVPLVFSTLPETPVMPDEQVFDTGVCHDAPQHREQPAVPDEPVFDAGISALTGKVRFVPDGLDLPADFLNDALPPLPDPFDEPLAADAGGGDDVFEFPRPAGAVESEAAETWLGVEMPDETAATPEPEFVVALSRGEEVPSVAGEVEDATAKALAQRVVPRLLAQVGEVRELELEVPVPAVWTGGRRLTLQFRLTLIPEEETHAD